MKRWIGKWPIWLIGTIVFLVIVQLLFSIQAPCKWLEAVWSAGDFITFVGTVVLGFVALKQTLYANEIAKVANQTAKEANDTSQKLIELQKSDYLPILTVSCFIGITRFKPSLINAIKTDVIMHEGRTKDNEVLLGYAINILTPEFDKAKDLHCRSYELQFEYDGNVIIKDIKILSIRFEDCDYKKEFALGKSLQGSLKKKDELKLFLFLIGNEDFCIESNENYDYIKTRRVVLDFSIQTINNDCYKESITIYKHLVKEPEKHFNSENVEFPVSVSYDLTRL